ncbi:MAG: hypothetical protein U0Z26_19620 [Anaerolineales bacterium]
MQILALSISIPTSARLEVQNCPFCEGGYKNGKWPSSVSRSIRFLDGKGHILITDENGNRLGYVDGKGH